MDEKMQIAVNSLTAIINLITALILLSKVNR